MKMYRWMVALILTIAIATQISSQPPVQEKKSTDRSSGVKARVKFETKDCIRIGQVVDVDEESLTIRHEMWLGKVETRRLFPINLFKAGQIVDGVSASYAYRWLDIRKGDTVHIEVVRDSQEDQEYCVGICISRRPGADLPLSQKPKGDVRYFRDNLLNEIENFNDVQDEDVAKAFPKVVHEGTGKIMSEGGLPGDYPAKLDAIRAKKKEQTLKAQPPVKKEK